MARTKAQPALFEGIEPGIDRTSLVEIFEAGYLRTYTLPYVRTRNDFVSMHRLIEQYGAVEIEARWERAVTNYLETPQSTHTLADLSRRFATFQRTSLDRYARPAQTKAEERHSHIRASLAQFLGGAQ